MSALDGFYSTWSKARATFGEGTPSDGSHYDGSSSQLLRMKGMIESAAPDDRWQGKGSEAYAAANKEHAGVYEKLAELDKKMAAEVTNAANVVTSGRNQLNATKSWVDSMVASLPATSAQDRENKLIPIANQGISQVNTTVQNANRDMFAIGTRVTGIKGEYDGLTNQKFGRGEEEGNSQQEKPDDDKKADGKPAEPGSNPGEPGGPEFVIGPPTKPDIPWDEDFDYNSAEPGLQDYLKRAEWEAKLAGGRLLRGDLDDATQMYRHYWDNDGKPIEFDYEEAYREDPGIRANVDDQVSRAQRGAEELIRAGNTSFSMTGDPNPTKNYPTTENWQKAVGGYQQWSSADVKVEGNKVTMTVTVHAEDHYNFNRGQSDIGTGASDNENGRFTELGWARPFDSHGEVTRTVTWELGSAPSADQGTQPQFNPGREDRADGRGSPGGVRPPDNNRNTGGVTLP
ncbi:EspA/EspE family type VII secretion system effector [Mycobacterium sp. URHD0025]|uniref:EspA/EspE family type VII secretion system effector n=1 Tax=Mycobacterium sp. URHD0025 TaxID=1298864 RepID=UPI00040BDBBC|nr:EspA/EspE family type VII secretion system effector [Mycobacterium sp. URHD0025]